MINKINFIKQHFDYKLGDTVWFITQSKVPTESKCMTCDGEGTLVVKNEKDNHVFNTKCYSCGGLGIINHDSKYLFQICETILNSFEFKLTDKGFVALVNKIECNFDLNVNCIDYTELLTYYFNFSDAKEALDNIIARDPTNRAIHPESC